MEIGTVNAASMMGMVFSIFVGIVLPIVLMILVWKKTGARISTFFIGCAVFIVFALVLESFMHAAVLGLTGTAITGNIWLYGLYGGLAAALFEEVGRLVAMKFFMKECLDMSNALMYGVGHGGIEAILILGMTSISNLVTSAMINSGALVSALEAMDGATASTTLEQLSALWTSPVYLFYLGGVERILAIILQIVMSVMVYQALKTGKKFFWFIAFMMHFVVDAVTVVTAKFLPTAAVEALVAVMVAAAVWIAVRLTQKETASEI